MSKTTLVARWTARILSVPVICVWAFFIIAYAIGPERSLPGNASDFIAYVAMITTIIALAVAWRWELAGSILSLAAAAVAAAVHPHSFWSATIIMPINAFLFLLSWGLSRKAGLK